MSQNFKIDFRLSKGNLHVIPEGDFDNFSAYELVHLLHEQYEGKGKVFINTQKLCKICPFGCKLFKSRLDKNRLPVHRLFFKGENGFKIAPDGSKVIVGHKKHNCRCNGDCANCACAEKKKLKEAIEEKNFKELKSH
jgi:hypothetical protein